MKVERSDASYMLYSMTAGHAATTPQHENQEHDTDVPFFASWDDTDMEGADMEDEEYFLDEEAFAQELAGCELHEIQSGLDTADDVPSSESEDSWSRIGRVATTGQKDVMGGHNSDWALIAFHDPFLYRPNLLIPPTPGEYGNPIGLLAEEKQHVRSELSENEVFLLGGTSGFKLGVLSSTWSYFMLPPAKDFTRHFALTFTDGSGMLPPRALGA